MSIVIDYPVPGPVSTSFPVGGTFSLIGKPSPGGKPAPGKEAPPVPPQPPPPMVTIAAYLYNSAGTVVASVPNCNIISSNSTWSGTLNTNGISYTDCYILAQLSINGAVESTDQVNGIDVVSGGGGGGITSSTMAGP